MATPSRAVRAFSQIASVERLGGDIVRVVSISDTYVVDVREQRCECPDYERNLDRRGHCKHLIAALDATGEVDLTDREVDVDLQERVEADD